MLGTSDLRIYLYVSLVWNAMTLRKTKYKLGHVIKKQEVIFLAIDLDLTYTESQRDYFILPDSYGSYDFLYSRVVVVTPSSWRYLKDCKPQKRHSFTNKTLHLLLYFFLF